MTEFSNSFSEEVWDTKYRVNNEPTVDDSFRRTAKHLASVETDPEKWEEAFFSILENFQVTLGGRILANAGTGLDTTMFNCYVSGPKGRDKDSIDGIYNALREQAHILKSEGGYGFCCSFMRPSGSHISGIANQSPGAVKFLELWDKSSEIITAGGSAAKRKDQKKAIRKGAQMVTMHCFHPDIEEFVTAKQQAGRLTKFNMSVLCTDAFMEAVLADEDWNLIFPNYEKYRDLYHEHWNGNYKLWDEVTGGADDAYTVYKTIKARYLWDLIMERCYNRAEPGCIFIDTVNRMNNLWYCEYLLSSNPCGEQYISIDDVCLLASLNLTQFIDPIFNDWNYSKLDHVIPILVRMMDNVNDVSPVPIKGQKEHLQKKRRIGLGVIGYGSALLMLGLRYGSEEALQKTEKLMDFIINKAYQSSAQLAQEKGAFPLFDREKYLKGEHVQILNERTREMIEEYGMRNSHVTSIQPTGNSSVFANLISSGLEPLFSFGFYRTVIVHVAPKGLKMPKGIDWDTKDFYSDHKGWSWTTEGDENILITKHGGKTYKYDRNRGLTREEWVEDYGVTYLKKEERWDEGADYAVNVFNLTVDDHVKTAQVFAKYICNAISKTVNIPHEYPYDEFKDLYIKAWQAGVKGFTTYREGTMTNVLSAKSTSEKIQKTSAPKRPKELPCDVYNISVKGQPYFVIVGTLEHEPYEVFAGRSINELHGCTSGRIVKSLKPKGYRAELENDVELFPLHAMSSDNEEALTRMASAALRHGADVSFVVDQLEKVKGDMTSFAKAVARALKNYIADGTQISAKCPECDKKSLIRTEGCKKCTNCSYTACG